MSYYFDARTRIISSYFRTLLWTVFQTSRTIFLSGRIRFNDVRNHLLTICTGGVRLTHYMINDQTAGCHMFRPSTRFAPVDLCIAYQAHPNF